VILITFYRIVISKNRYRTCHMDDKIRNHNTQSLSHARFPLGFGLGTCNGSRFRNRAETSTRRKKHRRALGSEKPVYEVPRALIAQEMERRMEMRRASSLTNR